MLRRLVGGTSQFLLFPFQNLHKIRHSLVHRQQAHVVSIVLHCNRQGLAIKPVFRLQYKSLEPLGEMVIDKGIKETLGGTFSAQDHNDGMTRSTKEIGFFVIAMAKGFLVFGGRVEMIH